MKRLAALVLAALMILGMTACGQKKDESKSKLDQIKEARTKKQRKISLSGLEVKKLRKSREKQVL